MTPETAPALRVDGPDAVGGVGDWALGNGTICAVLSDPRHESPLSREGGVLMDLGHCGRGDDQWASLEPLVNLSRSHGIPVRSLRPQVGQRQARIEAEGARDGISEHTVYAVDLDEPEVLHITTRLKRVGEGGRLFALANVILHSNAQLRPFSLDGRDRERSVGFAHPASDPDSPLSMMRAIVPATAHILVGSAAAGPPIAYGVELRGAYLEGPDGRRRPVSTLSLTGKSFTLIGAFARPFWLGGGGAPGLLQLAQLPFMDLRSGESLVFERAVRVSERADVASLTDALFAQGTPVSGRVDDAAARLHVETAAGAPVTELRPEASGRFAFRLPPGSYRLRARAAGGRSREQAFEVASQPVALAPLVLGTPARLHLPRGRVLRLVFQGLDGTPDPRFGDDLLGLRIGDREIPNSLLGNSVSLAGTPRDPRVLTLAPGHYRVLASRGPEFDLRQTTLRLRAGEVRDLDIEEPQRAFESPGWIGADLHVHSARSFDSALPLRDQVLAFAASGGEVMVSTEHDRVSDPQPVIQALGLGGILAGSAGVEITSTFRGGESPYTLGHWNAYPLQVDPLAYRGGAPAAEGRRPRDLAADLRHRPGPPLLQLNHPLGNDGAREDQRFLTHLGRVGKAYDPTLPLSAEPNRVLLEEDPETGLRDLDFQAIELMNGASLRGYRLVRADWLSWLRQGVRRTAVANSDSHRRGEIPALPRTYVALPDDRPGQLDRAAFRESLRAGRAFGSTGPFLQAELGGVGIGGTFHGRSGRLQVAVRAADWVPVSELRVHVNGELQQRRPISSGEHVQLPLRFDSDAFVTVEVEGVPGDLYRAVAPGFTPFAFSNPIFVDADGDGSWTAPGL